MRKQRRRWGTIRVIGAALLVCMGIEAVMPFANAGTAAQPSTVVGATTQPAKSKLCSVGTAVKYAANQLGLTTTGSGYSAYHDALVAAGILEENHLKDYEKNICAGEVAILASGIMDYLNEEVDEDIYTAVLEKDRISNLGKIAEKYREPIAKVFSAGVMVGKSNGRYSQDRKFISSETMTCAGMKNAVLKAMGKKKRSIMSPDGQLTRTTNLPKKYKRYKYILASFPNEFYDMKMWMDRATYSYEPVYMEDFTYPKDLMKMEAGTWDETFKFSKQYKMYGDMWYQKVYDNLNYRLNFDYRTVDDDWIEGLANTYWGTVREEELEMKRSMIRRYVAKAKKNHVVIKADKIVVEPSAIYDATGALWYRCYLRFKVTADEIYSAESERQDELIFRNSENSYHWLKNIKNGEYYEGVFDLNIGASAMNDTGYGYHVRFDGLWEYDNDFF